MYDASYAHTKRLDGTTPQQAMAVQATLKKKLEDARRISGYGEGID